MSFSDYYLTLKGVVKSRYDEKIKLIDNIDPYGLAISDLSKNLSVVPTVDTMDLVNYLILSHSFYTGDQLKAYKSLEAYKYYEAGFVQEVLAKKMHNNYCVVVGKVKHSQRIREKPLHVWVIVLPDGAISSGHCTCMAGLGEVCSHVAAILFFLKARPNELACTETLAQWPVPTLKNVDMVRIQDMDWARKPKAVALPQGGVPAIEGKELEDTIRHFKNLGITPAIARVCKPFAEEMSKKPSSSIPSGFEVFFDPALKTYTYDELVNYSINLNMTEEHIQTIEKLTRGQAQNTIWFKYRAGRITASKFKAVCTTKIEKPSVSLIKGICYPQKVSFYSKQTSYGTKHEQTAVEAYCHKTQKFHEELSFRPAGLYISSEHPELGASPDGIVKCKCCGLGCVEVKCPYLLKEMTLEDYAKKKDTCLIFNNKDDFSLDKKHAYFYQMQLQMFVTKAKYCDFIIWSKEHLFIDRVEYDEDFVKENLAKALNFFKHVIKPEMLSKFFTRQCGTEMWCICKMPDNGQPMLRCDSESCDIQWFHFQCIGITEEPQNVWFCDACL